ncbi:5-hydroxytryptamine receptor 3A-like [Colossoma macropomum]|uniref:5-hydroxytryptamine receptor 3A-like n=1 Tax=Colossoma macropomum TaxID=42526 RepID=UPI0018651BC2|nr:5-hydroxytryptamine receptor 3A-like [Colossoma macropomum]
MLVEKDNMVPAKRILNIFFILSHLIVWFNVMVGAVSPCVSRRCLANDLIAKGLYSPPQPPTCAVMVNLTSIQYETLSVDTKTLRFSSRIKIEMEWRDPDLAWSDQQYKFTELMLPVDKIWTPDLTVDNAVETEVKPVSTDILVGQDGTVQHSIQMYTTVVCGINLFNYPFVTDACPVALNGWSQSSCGLRFQYGTISTVGTNRGEWRTLSVELRGNKDRLDRNYLYVTMSINPFNTIVTLILPSVLIMVADLVSFALPLEGGKRSSFKITLVLSFTMSLLILTDSLPDTGLCSPLIRYHFCFCLVLLVLSLLASMIFTRLAVDGSLFSCTLPKRHESDKLKAKTDTKQDISLNGVATVYADVSTEEASVQKVVTFLENMEKANEESKKRQFFANRFDKICFWIYFCIDVIYIICLTAITRTEFCKINNLDFWSS